MATSANILSSEQHSSYLRPVDTTRDLRAVADLIECCFRDSLDPDGQDYIKHLRDAARFSFLSSWTTTLAEDEAILPLSGYVWVEDDRVVGNLSLIPFQSMGKRCYLIANVAVLPAYRGKGIATQLTRRALEHVQEHHGAAAWLQVREDNPIAIHIYERLGFQERARRTTWINTLSIPNASANGYPIHNRLPAYWAQQRAWLQRMYPAEFSWHLPVNWRAIQPGWKGDLYRFFNLNYPKHWTVTCTGELCGVLTWMSQASHTDYLLLAAPEEPNQEAIQALLVQARKSLPARRRLSLNLPTGFAADAVQAAGFTKQQTLIWMEIKY